MTRTHVMAGAAMTAALTAVVPLTRFLAARDHEARGGGSRAIFLSAPAGTRPAMRHTTIDGVAEAVLPNGRLLTPAGIEIGVNALKPYGLALSPDGQARLGRSAQPPDPICARPAALWSRAMPSV